MDHLVKIHQATKQFLLPALTLSLLASLSHAAPAAPDAGQTMRELQKKPELKAPTETVPLRIEGAPVAKPSGNDSVRIAVKAIRIEGNEVFPAAELESLVHNLVGGAHTLAELDAGAAQITRYYRERGYVVARAFLPAQDIRDGAVAIRVLEGRLGKRVLNNQSRVSDSRANPYLDAIRGGDALQGEPVDRALLLLADTPGVGGARAALQPGASVGTSDLVVELAPAEPYAASIDLSNSGNRYTGEYLLGAALAFNSPFGIGDQFTLRALTSDQDLTYGRVAYQIPLGGDGLRVGVAYSDTRYQLGRDFSALQAHGKARSASAFAIYPIVRSQSASLFGTLTLEDKKLNDRTDAPVTVSDKHVQLANLGLAGSRQDGLGGGGISAIDVSLVFGHLGMDAQSLVVDNLTAKSSGSFSRITYRLNRLQRLSGKDTLSLAFSGQQTNKNLNSSEQFSVGGVNGVRAYPQGEGNGDEGWLANLELRHDFTANLQGVAFYDAGSVKISHDQFAAGANSRNIAGAGFGVNTHVAGLQMKAYAAWRTSGGPAISEPVSADRNPRLWLQASKQF